MSDEFLHNTEDTSSQFSSNGKQKNVDELLAELETEQVDTDSVDEAFEALTNNAIAFIHFDSLSAKSNMLEALVHSNDLYKIDRGQYVVIFCKKDSKKYVGRIVEGPFFDPDVLKRDSTPLQFIILNQGGNKKPFIPEYHGRIVIELLGEERNGMILGAMRRPHPGSPVQPYDQTMMQSMFNLTGNICLGYLDNYEDVFVRMDEKDKGYIPRNILTVGTIGSGKSNTNQVFIEETVANNFAQIVLDPEGEYIFMDQPSDAPGLGEELTHFGRKPQGVKNITVYHPPLATSKRPGAVAFSVPFDSLSQELIMELIEVSTAQETRFSALYEQAVSCLRKANSNRSPFRYEQIDVSKGYEGIRLSMLINMLDQELEYYQWKRGRDKSSQTSSRKQKTTPPSGTTTSEETEEGSAQQDMEIYCHKYKLAPLIQDQHDESSYSTLRKKLRSLQRTRIFYEKNAPSPLKVEQLCRPGHLSVIDLSDCANQQVINIIIADLLARVYRYKMNMSEKENEKHKVIITIEEAHGFVSRERQEKMAETLDQLRWIARRGRKRWLCLHLVTQSPQHLPSELFELANNKIIHQMTGSENLRVLKAAAGTINDAIWDEVPSLGRGRAIIVSSQYPHPIIARIRRAASRRNYQS